MATISGGTSQIQRNAHRPQHGPAVLLIPFGLIPFADPSRLEPPAGNSQPPPGDDVLNGTDTASREAPGAHRRPVRGRPRAWPGSRSTARALQRVPRPHGRRADHGASSGPGPTRASASSRSPAPATRPSARAATRSSAPRPATTARPSRASSRSRPAPDHPRHPQAGDRCRQRRGHRRRPRAARPVRPDDRRRHRAVRPVGPARRLLRRRLRLRLPGSRDRREAGPRAVVPLPPLRRRRGRGLGPGQRGRAGRRAARGGPPLGRRDADHFPTALQGAQALASTPTPSPSPGWPGSPSTRSTSSSSRPRPRRASSAFAERRPPDFSAYR